MSKDGLLQRSAAVWRRCIGDLGCTVGGTFVQHLVLSQLRVFLFCVTVMALFLLGFGIAKEAVIEGFGLNVALRLFPYVLPDAVRFAAPAAALFAVCKVYGEMSAANELLALKSLGISPTRVFWPGILFGTLLSLPTLWLTDVAASWGYNGVRRVVIQSVEDIAYDGLMQQRCYRSSRFSVHTKRLEGRRLVSPTLWFPATADSPAIIATATTGELRSNPSKNTLAIDLHNGRIEYDGGVCAHFPDTQTLEVPLTDASRFREPVAYCLRELPAEIARQQERVQQLERELAGCDTLVEPLLAQPPGTTDKERRLAAELAQQRQWLSALKTKPHRRWAWGWSCLCFVTVGMPLAVRLRRADYLSVFFAAFLPILSVNYLVLSYTVALTNFGRLPPSSVWIGNLLLLAAGGWLLWAARR